jgi:predicted nucleic acid-binding protein
VTACSVFVDTNVLVYQTFEDFEPDKHALVTSTLQQLID